MKRTITLKGGLLVAAALLAGVIAAIYATRSTGASGSQTRVVMTAKNSKLDETILVDRRGRTLYSLSAERHGRFICTDMACLSIWKPLTVQKGKTPSGVAHLSTVKRPGGGLQVVFRGGPLYSFTGDHARGDVKGNGFKDVGTWRVVRVSGASSAPAPASPYHY